MNKREMANELQREYLKEGEENKENSKGRITEIIGELNKEISETAEEELTEILKEQKKDYISKDT